MIIVAERGNRNKFKTKAKRVLKIKQNRKTVFIIIIMAKTIKKINRNRLSKSKKKRKFNKTTFSKLDLYFYYYRKYIKV